MESSMSIVFSSKTSMRKEKESSLSRVIDFILASLLLFPASLIVSIIFIIFKLKVKDNGSFLYKNYRLGKDRKSFYCLKIRTLIVDAEKSIGSKIYKGDEKLDLWYGKFLRKTRLDELPQLINILKGEMSFLGPRPVRPLQYEEHMAHISGAEKIFSVRPGLTGYSQFLTPAGSDKRIRAKIDSIFYSKQISEINRISFTIWTALQCFYLVLKEILKAISHKRKMIMNGKYPKENRNLHREYPKKNITGFFITTHNNNKELFLVADVNYSAMRILTKNKINSDDRFQFSIHVKINRNGSVRKNRVTCNGKVIFNRTGVNNDNSENKHCYIIEYEPQSTFQRYIIDKYVLKASIA